MHWTANWIEKDAQPSFFVELLIPSHLVDFLGTTAVCCRSSSFLSIIYQIRLNFFPFLVMYSCPLSCLPALVFKNGMAPRFDQKKNRVGCFLFPTRLCVDSFVWIEKMFFFFLLFLLSILLFCTSMSFTLLSGRLSRLPQSLGVGIIRQICLESRKCSGKKRHGEETKQQQPGLRRKTGGTS